MVENNKNAAGKFSRAFADLKGRVADRHAGVVE
jgi:hypothetical protein